MDEETYKKKVAELQAKRQAEMQLRQVLQQLLEPAAMERLANINMSNPALYEQLASIVVYLQQKGQLKSKLTDEQLKQLVARILSQKQETKITFARK